MSIIYRPLAIAIYVEGEIHVRTSVCYHKTNGINVTVHFFTGLNKGVPINHEKNQTPTPTHLVDAVGEH